MKKIVLKALMTVIECLTTILCVGYLVTVIYTLTIKPLEPEHKTDAIVVLTGGKNRIQTGLKLYSRGLSQKIFISGVHSKVKKEEILASWEGEQELPKCCIDIGYEALTTLGNAEETKEWMNKNNIKSIRLVTSDYHMWRSIIVFKNAMPDIELYPHPVKQKELEITTSKFWSLTMTEYLKTLFRQIKITAGLK